MAQIIVRCGAENCGLRQYKTANNRCRKCSAELPEVVTVEYGDEIPEEPAVMPSGARVVLPKAKGRVKTTPMDFGSIAHKFVRARHDAQLTQQEMANLLGLPRTYVSRIENGHLIPGCRMLEKCATALAVPITALLPSDPLDDEILSEFNWLDREQQRTILDRVKEMNTNDTTA